MPVSSSQEHERTCICMLMVSNLTLFLRFSYWILELFRQWDICRFSFYCRNILTIQTRNNNNFVHSVLINVFLLSALGGWYSYRLSKAALNMATKNLSIELGRGKKKVTCIALHPGTVDTDLSRAYHKSVPKLFSTEESVRMMLEVIDSLSIDDSGKLFTYDRTQLPF